MELMERDIKKIVGENLRKFRGEKSIYRISKDTGVGESYLHQCENGNVNLSIETLEKLANYYGIHPAEFFGVQIKPPPKLEYRIEIVKKPGIAERTENYQPIPLLRDPVSLGLGLELQEKDIEGTVLIHTSKLRRGGEYHALKMKGDSMSPVLNDGDIVAVDIKLRDPKTLNNKIVLAKIIDEEVTVKLFKILGKQFRFIALNPDWEQNHIPLITLAKDDILLGKVIWAWKSFE